MQYSEEEYAKAAREIDDSRHEIEDSLHDEQTGPPSPITKSQLRERLENAVAAGAVSSTLLSLLDGNPRKALQAIPQHVAEKYALPVFGRKLSPLANVKERLERAVANGHLDSLVLSLADADLRKALGSIPESVAKACGLPIVKGGRPVSVWIPQTGR